MCLPCDSKCSTCSESTVNCVECAANRFPGIYHL